MNNARTQGEKRATGRNSEIILNLSSAVYWSKHRKTYSRTGCVNESFRSVVGIPSQMLTDCRGCLSFARHSPLDSHAISVISILALLRCGDDKSRRGTFVLTSTSTCDDKRQKRQVGIQVRPVGGNLKQSGTVPKVRVGTTRVYVKGEWGGG